MPIKKSAAKEIRKTAKRTIANDNKRKNLEFLMIKFKKSITNKALDKANEYGKQIIKAVDKMAKTNVIKKNTASRNKSRLMKKLNNLKKGTETK